ILPQKLKEFTCGKDRLAILDRLLRFSRLGARFCDHEDVASRFRHIGYRGVSRATRELFRVSPRVSPSPNHDGTGETHAGPVAYDLRALDLAHRFELWIEDLRAEQRLCFSQALDGGPIKVRSLHRDLQVLHLLFDVRCRAVVW